MKQKLISFCSLFVFSIFLITSCKKENDSTEKLTADAEVAMHYDDEALVSSEIDAIASDINSVLESDPALSGDASVLEEVICDATVTANFQSNPMTVTVVFNGASCGGNKIRTGTMVLSMPQGTQWKDEGAAITITVENLKIERKSDSKSITLNGSKTYTNVSGGLVHQAASLGLVVHTITSNSLSIKFDDGTARNWNIARKKEFSYSNGLVITVKGFHQEGDDTNVAEWGTNRFGESFSTLISEPVVLKQECDFRVTGGEIKHKTQVFTAVATFGLDASGNPTSCPGSGKYYYKLDWTRNSNGNSFNLLLPY